MADRGLTPNESARVGQLTDAELAEIDTALMAQATPCGRKVAMVVALAMRALGSRSEGLPDVYFAERIRLLVDDGRLLADGNLDHMRFSEVRIPGST